MSGFAISPTTSFGLGIASNIKRALSFSVHTASNVPVRVPTIAETSVDLDAEFAAMAAETAEWSRTTFGAAAEIWPAE